MRRTVAVMSITVTLQFRAFSGPTRHGDRLTIPRCASRRQPIRSPRKASSLFARMSTCPLSGSGHTEEKRMDFEVRTHAAFIWSIADLLRGTYKQSDYGKVILPLVV